MAVLKEIKEAEEEIAEVLQKSLEQVVPLDKQLLFEVAKLGERRYSLVSGKAHPETSELEGLQDQEALAAATGAIGAGSKGCPFFWCSVLSNCDAISDHISARDRLAFEYLRDVRRLGGHDDGALGVELVFDAKNPYFTNKTLKRVIGEDVDEGTDIDWKPGMNITVKEVTKKAKKAKKGKKGAGAADEEPSVRTRLKPCPSFFRFFEVSGGAGHPMEQLLGPEIQEADEGRDDEEAARAKAKLEDDTQVLHALLSEVTLCATHLYLEGPQMQSSGTGGRGAGSGSSDDEDDYEMVAGGSGAVEDLPPATRAVVAALRSVQEKMDKAAARHRAERQKLSAEAASRVHELYAKRRALLAAAGANAPRCFWLRVLRSIDQAALAITARDAAVLQHLLDVRYDVTYDAPDSSGSGGRGSSSIGSKQRQEVHATLELEFSDSCPQLAASSRTLKKSYTFVASSTGALRLLVSRVLVSPEWAAQDPMHRRGRDGRSRPCASFFHLFKSGGGGGKLVFNLTGPEKEVQSEANELEVEMLEELHKVVLPQAAVVYEDADRGDDIASEGDDDEPSDEENEEGGSDGSDNEAAAAWRAVTKHKKDKEARPWWKLSKGGVLILLLLLMLVAQYLALAFHLTSGG